LLLDDELPGLTYLKMLCEQIPELEVVKAFNSPVTFLNELPGLDFDLLITDIEMPGMDGLHIARLMEGRSIIFTTAYSEHAAEAFDLNAVDYVRKPVRKERLQQAVRKAMERSLEGAPPIKEFIQLNTDKGRSLIYFDRLCHVSTSATDSRDKVARMWDGSVLVLKNISFEKLLSQLPTVLLCRVNKREALAMRAVQSFSHDEIVTTLKGPSGRALTLTLSDAYREDFIRRVGL
jgi:DNA-binding LytR/AlgR family response regulator